jgi:hypothetical protein
MNAGQIDKRLDVLRHMMGMLEGKCHAQPAVAQGDQRREKATGSIHVRQSAHRRSPFLKG